MRTRADFIKRLHDSPRFKDALKMARTDAERKTLMASAEHLVDSFAVFLAPIIAQTEDDPEFARKLGRQLLENQGLVTASDPALTGSTG